MGKIGIFIYSRPLEQIIILMCIMLLFWAKLAQVNKEKNKQTWKVFNGILALLFLTGIVIMTMLRGEDSYELILRPFASLLQAQTQPEMYRSMFMNIFLFFPLGLTLPFALPEKWNRRALITILFSMVLSITIECLQYHYHLGRAETDDVICNTLGAIIGTVSYILSRKSNAK